MSALNTKPNEPSMEEILASIRRIITDDEERMAAQAPVEQRSASIEQPSFAQPLPPQSPAAPLASAPPAPAAPLPSDLQDTRPRSEFAPRPRSANESETKVVSGGTQQAVSHAFRHLNETAQARPPMTVEQLVVDTIRPMLREWLDAHLAGLVKDMVREEIERIARRSR
jgi:cell pole-organizing protein PopZ